MRFKIKDQLKVRAELCITLQEEIFNSMASKKFVQLFEISRGSKYRRQVNRELRQRLGESHIRIRGHIVFSAIFRACFFSRHGNNQSGKLIDCNR